MDNDCYVLYIEDDEDDILVFTESFCEVCNSPVYYLQEAEKLNDFLAQHQGTRPCLFVVDMNLVKYTGLEVLQQIRASETYGQLPVVILTTSASNADREACQKMDAELLIKPNTYDDWKNMGKQLSRFCLQ